MRSLNDMPTLKVKDKTQFIEFRASKRMKNKKYISKALLECLTANDTEGFKEILRTHLELINKRGICQKSRYFKKKSF